MPLLRPRRRPPPAPLLLLLLFLVAAAAPSLASAAAAQDDDGYPSSFDFEDEETSPPPLPSPSIEDVAPDAVVSELRGSPPWKLPDLFVRRAALVECEGGQVR